MTRRRYFLVGSAGLLPLLIGLLLFAEYWFVRGPGLISCGGRLTGFLRPGMTVAEIGAGSGRLALLTGHWLGPGGRLYATELGAAKLDRLRRETAGARNLTIVPGDVHSTNLPPGCCDAIYMRHVYHHFSDTQGMNRSLAASLRPGGRLVVIDFLTPRWLPIRRHGIAPDRLIEQLSAEGFLLERRIPDWSSIDYCLVFRR